MQQKNFTKRFGNKPMKRRASFLFSILFLCISAYAQISVSSNGRYLVSKDGKPFFWLGDTDWELFHRLTREEAAAFIETRHQQGFNVIQAVALAEFNGVREPN